MGKGGFYPIHLSPLVALSFTFKMPALPLLKISFLFFSTHIWTQMLSSILPIRKELIRWIIRSCSWLKASQWVIQLSRNSAFNPNEPSSKGGLLSLLHWEDILGQERPLCSPLIPKRSNSFFQLRLHDACLMMLGWLLGLFCDSEKRIRRTFLLWSFMFPQYRASYSMWQGEQ